MTHSASVPLLGSEFDVFLFAPVGDDLNGMQLSVLSAFARLDVDPWQEATSLARLPRVDAKDRLISLLAALPTEPTTYREAATIATRLITLLPRETGSIPSYRTILSAGEPTNRQAVGRAVIAYVILVGFLLSLQLFAVSRQMPAQTGDVQAASSHTASLQPPTRDSVQRHPAGPAGQERP